MILRALSLALLALWQPALAHAQSSDSAVSQANSDPQTAHAEPADPPTTIFLHSESSRIYVAGQANFISQWHPRFASPYRGTNSLSPEPQDATSRVLTLFTGLQLTPTSELLFDVQETGGHGIGEALGLAGFTNLDVVRNPTIGAAPYVARLMWHHIVPLGRRKVAAQRSPLSLFTELPERRLEIRFGKFSLADFFDLNTYGSDSNLQFMNWTTDNAGTYDYAADTRGFTVGAILEYHQGRWAVRFAEVLMPKVANGIHLDASLSRARAENVEFEIRGSVLPARPGTLRLLSFVNHANMGDYRESIANFRAGLTPVPEIATHPLRTSVKYGFGLNFEQPLNDSLAIFGRWGWNEGRHESYAYTEVDQTFELGFGSDGKRWRRRLDRAGFVFVSNGISRDHQQYLALGGSGFLLGDGRLDYGREKILESFYTVHLWRGVFGSFDLQHINNPGYNRDRGPVLVPAIRLHLDL